MRIEKICFNVYGKFFTTIYAKRLKHVKDNIWWTYDDVDDNRDEVIKELCSKILELKEGTANFEIEFKE